MASPIQKVVIFFMENHTTDNVASEVAGVDGNSALPLAPDVVVHDPPHDHAHWLTRDEPAPGGARRERYSGAQLPNLRRWMNAFTVCDRYFSDFAGNSFPNHAFAVGADARAAVKTAVMCEDVARTVHLARSLGPVQRLAQSDIDLLHQRYQNVYGQR